MDEDITISDIKRFSKSIKNHKENIEAINECIDFCIDDYNNTENMSMLTLSKKLHVIREKMEGKHE